MQMQCNAHSIQTLIFQNIKTDGQTALVFRGGGLDDKLNYTIDDHQLGHEEGCKQVTHTPRQDNSIRRDGQIDALLGTRTALRPQCSNLRSVKPKRSALSPIRLNQLNLTKSISFTFEDLRLAQPISASIATRKRNNNNNNTAQHNNNPNPRSDRFASSSRVTSPCPGQGQGL